MAKSRAAGEGSIRQRKDGRWEGRYTAGYDPATGKQIQRSIYGVTKQEVRQKLTRIEAELDDGSYVAPNRETLGEWLDMWLKIYAKIAVKPYTFDSYERSIKNHIKPALGAVRLTDLSPLQIQQLYVSLLEEKKLSVKTVHNIHGVLHQSLEKAVKLGKIRYNPTGACKLPKAPKPKINPMEADDLRLFLNEVRNHKYGRVYWIIIFCGMRESEALGLTWDCVDFDRCQILVKQQLLKTKKVGGVYALVSTKNDCERIIHVAPSVMDKLREQKQWQEQMQAVTGEEWSNQWNLVFTHENGKHLCAVTVYKRFKEIVTKLGMPAERVHDLRHTYATMSLEYGDDIKTLQENLGHATAAFTLSTYGHVTRQMRQKSADRMEQCIQAVEGA